MADNNWTVYIIEAADGRLYTGITTDLDRRFGEHAADPKKGARFFRVSVPRSIVYKEGGLTRSAASKREAAIKKLKRAEKLKLIGRG